MNKAFFWILVFLVGTIFASNYYIFIAQKKYNFIVEAPCTETGRVCFSRDCSIEGDCPPNNFDEYRVFNIGASDFKKCSDNSCLKECSQDIIDCEEIVCNPDNGDTCIVL